MVGRLIQQQHVGLLQDEANTLDHRRFRSMHEPWMVVGCSNRNRRRL
jgi:hypothetical protein